MSYMPGYKSNHYLKLCFPLELHDDDGSTLRLNDGPGVKLSSVGWCLVLLFGWTNCVVFFSFDFL